MCYFIYLFSFSFPLAFVIISSVCVWLQCTCTQRLQYISDQNFWYNRRERNKGQKVSHGFGGQEQFRQIAFPSTTSCDPPQNIRLLSLLLLLLSSFSSFRFDSLPSLKNQKELLRHNFNWIISVVPGKNPPTRIFTYSIRCHFWFSSLYSFVMRNQWISDLILGYFIHLFLHSFHSEYISDASLLLPSVLISWSKSEGFLFFLFWWKSNDAAPYFGPKKVEGKKRDPMENK